MTLALRQLADGVRARSSAEMRLEPKVRAVLDGTA